eukprot:4853468-Karenia_brevis.AAC.1
MKGVNPSLRTEEPVSRRLEGSIGGPASLSSELLLFSRDGPNHCDGVGTLDLALLISFNLLLATGLRLT